jgi:hypothetical protein
MPLQEIEAQLKWLQRKLDIKSDEVTNERIEALLKERDTLEEQAERDSRKRTA